VIWRYQNFPPEPPVAGIHHKVMDAPIGILDQHVCNVTDVSVAGMDMIARHLLDAPKMTGPAAVRGCIGLPLAEFRSEIG
jgi:hypothetical protein